MTRHEDRNKKDEGSNVIGGRSFDQIEMQYLFKGFT